MNDANTTGLLIAALLLGALATNCGEREPRSSQAPPAGPAQHDHPHGPHGGVLIAVGRTGTQLEVLLDPKENEVALHFLAADGRTAVPVEGPVHLNVQTRTGPERVQAVPVAGNPGSFTCKHDGFRKLNPVGQIVFALAGKEYYLSLPEGHDDHGGHPPGEEDDHGHDHGHGEDCLSVTHWSDRFEWFVELPLPERGKVATFTAHVTFLDGFRPATSGLLSVEATTGERKIASQGFGPVRPGVFTPTITFPTAGEWTVLFTFSDQGISDRLEWPVQVLEPGDPAPSLPAAQEGIGFTKERQWQVPLATGLSTSRIKTDGSRELMVPSEAVLRKGDQSFLVLQIAGELFRVQAVTTAPADKGLVRVEKGLSGDERIVLKGIEHLPLP